MQGFIDPTGRISDPYRSFIHTSRYARWLEEEGRRETWVETVDRYMSFMTNHLSVNHQYFPSPDEVERVRRFILEHKALPSMRALMTAGPALERNNIAGYNCSYVVMDSPVAFDEVLYILMNGTGVGFSVESKYVSRLPIVPNTLSWSSDNIVVGDSKEGWAYAYRALIGSLYNGLIPGIDVSQVRPAGARLKTFGGRASGPEPLVDLFNYTISVFQNAAGRKLTDIEVHDIVCKIASVVVVGGVRRSALISLGDLNSDAHREAKSGEWWLGNVHRALANNSAVYEGVPSREVFDREWDALASSGSGERGIFSRVASNIQAGKNGRRRTDFDFGTNPCCVAPDTILMTEDGPREIRSLEGRKFNAIVNGEVYNAPRGSWISGEGEIYRLSTKAGYEVELTPEHRILTKNRGWVEARNLERGDMIVIHDHGVRSWGGPGTFGEGYLLGAFKGDGNFIKPISGSSGEVKLWNHDFHQEVADEMFGYAEALPHRSDWNGWGQCGEYRRMSIGKLPLEYGMDHGSKVVSRQIELASSEFQRGFMRGWFDADGHIEGNEVKSFSIRLGSNDLDGLKAAQRILLRLGIKSRIYFQRSAGASLLPDGSGGRREYTTKAMWRLVVSSSDIVRFNDVVGFSNPRKAALVADIVESTRFYSKPFVTEFESLEFVRVGDVWDAEVSEVHAFDANGIYAHNSEIILRPNEFCNLSTVVVRAEDDLTDLVEKVEVAAILGTWQASLTNFKYIRDIWRQNTEDERLLGVSMTGPFSNKLLTSLRTTPEILRYLKNVAVETNARVADEIGINRAAAITCIKPEGTSSQLTLTSSGLHAWHAPYYIRTVRQAKSDPLTQFMIDSGFYYEDDVTNPDKTAVFYFPIAAPEGSITRNDLSPIEHLELWLMYQREWCEHKPSVTIYVKPDEWAAVGDWVYKHFDEMSGVSFMPHSEHTYEQAPYQDISKEEYDAWLEKMPNQVNWDLLSLYEIEDTTTGIQELACVAGQCEVVGIEKEFAS